MSLHSRPSPRLPRELLALQDQRLALIGPGVIGRILIQRLQGAGLPASQLMVCDDDPARGARVQREFGLKVCPLADACCRADIWLLAAPPRATLDALHAFAPRLKEGQIVISFAAGVSMARLEAILPDSVAMARVMPNALSLIGRGVNPVAYGQACTLGVRTQVQAILNVLGDSIVIEDEQMDWAVGLTGASMRWLLPVLEGMTQAGVDAGLPPLDARWVAAKMMAGVAALALETDLTFEDMKTLTSVQVVDEEALARTFREAARRAKAMAEALFQK
ncbi:MAG TPA: hypothetical protein EYP25_04005 [Anaerolineae bacterium]|nr:NAD(P)-binding domain-containing protein [Caldilineae bacterium]HID33728.1 hypothetical protein [Anaerolineae bacterium]